MNTFASAVDNRIERTENGMKAFATSANACVDLFYNIGASRGKNIVPQFIAAYVENREVAMRIALWARDARKGAGERKIFRDILNYLENTNTSDAMALMYKTPELGRWDDLLCFTSEELKNEANNLIAVALSKGDQLCAKWMPRKGEQAVALRKYLEATPKEYRKLLVSLTNVVETQMCAKDWDNINFSHVPSLAAARYRNAFKRNTVKYAEYVAALVKGDDPKVKVNTGAVYPYDVLKSALEELKSRRGGQLSATDIDFINAQWAALPNYIESGNILPMVDVSGSMEQPVGNSGTLTAMDVALSLGLYCADKNNGKFKDIILTFSANPQLMRVSGNVVQKIQQLKSADWGMNTNIISAIDKILSVAIQSRVPQHEMPSMLLIFSDMQFDNCARFDDSAIEAFRRRYEAAGYTLPKIVFWNLAARSKNSPVQSHENGTALVSGFSPTLMTSLLSNNLEQFTPESIMLETVMVKRYDF